MNKGIKRLFVGYLLTMFHITVGQLEILPGFVAWFIVLSGCHILLEEGGDERWLRTYRLSQMLVGVSFLFFLTGWISNGIIAYSLSILSLPVCCILELLLEYSILKAFCLSYQNSMPEICSEFAMKARNYSMVYMLLIIIGTICVIIPQPGKSSITLILMFLVRLYYLVQIQHMKKLTEEEWCA